MARKQRYEPDSILTFDRGYLDYHWFDQLHRQGVFFVTRMKKNARHTVLERRRVEKKEGLTSDQTIRMIERVSVDPVTSQSRSGE